MSAGASPTLALAAINGKNALYFDGVDARIRFATDAAQTAAALSAVVGAGSYTLVTVAKLDGAPSATQHLWGDTNYWAQEISSSGYRFRHNIGSNNNTPYITLEAAAPHVFFAWAQNTVNCGAQLDGGTPVTGTSAFGNANINGNASASLGATANGTAFFKGWVCEVLVYSKVLSVQERADAYEALAAEWIISAASGASAAPKFEIAPAPNRGIINGRRPCWA